MDNTAPGYSNRDRKFSAVLRRKPSPAVLIVHTHGTECYSQNGSTYSDAEIGFRSKDTEENMIAVGKKQPQTLSQFGISVLHCNHA